MKMIVSVVTTVAICAAMSMISMAASVYTYANNQYGGGYNNEVKGEWKQDNVGWWFAKDSGGWCQNEWVFYNGEFYYFNGNGYMAANQWVNSNGNWYYMKDTGIIATNETTPDGYYVDYDGIWQQNKPSGGSISSGGSSSGGSSSGSSSSSSTTTHTQTYLRAVDDLDDKYDTTDITPELIVEAISDWRELYGEYRYGKPFSSVEYNDELSNYAQVGIEDWIDIGVGHETAHIRANGKTGAEGITGSSTTEIAIYSLSSSATVRTMMYGWANSNGHRSCMAIKGIRQAGAAIDRENGIVIVDFAGSSFSFKN